jgi:hypothetical protein
VLRGSIVIAARAPMTKVVRPGLIVLGLVIVMSAFVGYKAESLFGDSWRETCRAGVDRELTNSNACVMANAMPDQGGALDTLLEQLDRKPTPSEAALQERIVLSRLVEDCHASLSRLERIDRPELAIEEARRCGDYQAEEVALAELGRFGEAAAVPSQLTGFRTDVRGRILVMAGAWRPAAAYAEARATDLRSQPTEADPDRRDQIAGAIVGWQCIAALMQYYADSSETSAARIRELASGPHGERCVPELAEIGTDEERARVLGGNHDPGPSWRAFEVERQLAGLGTTYNEGMPALLLQGSSDGSGMTYGPAIWAARLTPPLAETAEVGARFNDATQRLAIAVWMRDFAAAHRYADRAIELRGEQLTGYDAQFTSLFHPMIDLYTAKTPLDLPPPPAHDDQEVDDSLAHVWRFMTAHLAMRHGDSFDTATFVVTREMQTALTAAQHGDGAALAGTLDDDGTTAPLDLIAVLPMVKTHREELVRALPWMPGSSRILDYRFPFATAQYYAERRTMFELAGDAINAKRAGEIFERYVAAFHDHRRLVALSLLEF